LITAKLAECGVRPFPPDGGAESALVEFCAWVLNADVFGCVWRGGRAPGAAASKTALAKSCKQF